MSHQCGDMEERFKGYSYTNGCVPKASPCKWFCKKSQDSFNVFVKPDDTIKTLCQALVSRGQLGSVNSISAYIPEKKGIDVPFNKSEINQDWSLLLDLDEKIIECFDLDTMDKVLIFNDRPVHGW